MKAYAIYGPPGTGKTTEMLRRVEELRGTYKPNEIGFVSFTRAAATEALQRLGLTRSDYISTIHSWCFRALQLSQTLVINRERMIEFAALTGVPMGFGSVEDEDGAIEEGDEYMAILSRARAKLADPLDEYMASERPGDPDRYEMFIDAYAKWKRERGFLDFQDMLDDFIAADGVAHRARVLFVDEAQDLSPSQWAVIELIASSCEEVHIAGDDDQAIYEWSGANPHGMVTFEKLHDAQRHVLAQSYRVPKHVWEVANGVISRVDNRVPKSYLPREGGPGVARSMQYIDIKPELRTFILARNHSVIKEQIEPVLLNDCVPYAKVGGLPGPFEHRAGRALLALDSLRQGQPITTAGLETLLSGVQSHLRDAVRKRQFDQLLSRDPLDVIAAPWRYRHYYGKVDLRKKPDVTVMTIHASKGKEADHVILFDSMGGRTATEAVKNPDAEARVWYVGVTRAKKQLDIIEGDDPFGVM